MGQTLRILRWSILMKMKKMSRQTKRAQTGQIPKILKTATLEIVMMPRHFLVQKVRIPNPTALTEIAKRKRSKTRKRRQCEEYRRRLNQKGNQKEKEGGQGKLRRRARQMRQMRRQRLRKLQRKKQKRQHPNPRKQRKMLQKKQRKRQKNTQSDYPDQRNQRKNTPGRG